MVCQIPPLETSFLFLPPGIAQASSGLYGCSCYLGFCLIALPFCVGLEAKQSGSSNTRLETPFLFGRPRSCLGLYALLMFLGVLSSARMQHQ